MTDSISLEQIQEQQGQLQQTVSNLVAQKATLEEQLENCKSTLSSNQGALQYASVLIQSAAEDDESTSSAEEISIVSTDDNSEEGEDITL